MANVRQRGKAMVEISDTLLQGVEEKALRSYRVLQASPARPSGSSNIKIMALERSKPLA
jgi:hypothetical protein